MGWRKLTGQVLEVLDFIDPDRQATRLCSIYMELDMARTPWRNRVKEVRQYLYATDTSQTSNSRLPWKNKTTYPKLCQIADNLLANYLLTMFPKPKSIFWLANDKDSNSKAKRDAIQNYMYWVVSQPQFKEELVKVLQDYIQAGNGIAMPEWSDYRVSQKDGTQVGYIGPSMRRINPEDCVINPTAENFIRSPKFIRTIISMGELKKHLEKLSNDDNREAYSKLFDYMKDIRSRARNFTGDFTSRDEMFNMDGFGSFRQYLMSDTVELITFYGDWYDSHNDTFEENRIISFVDRHKIIDNKPNPSFFGYAPIFHAPWRKRQDNIWGMSPLENLVGMQYSIDKRLNQMADILDLTAYPVQKITGFVDEFTWQPGEKIFVSDEGNVELVQPDIQIQQLIQDIALTEVKMEEMAGAPKEAMGFRSPGEKTKYEVQRLENAASRIFQNKINQFEEQILEPCLNAMLELARRNMVNSTSIPVFDDTYNLQVFQDLTVDDITGIGRIKCIGSRHFAEQAELTQNLQNLTASGMWPYIQQHYSSIGLAKLHEELFDLPPGIVSPDIGLFEQADAQRKVQAMQEQLHQEMGTASGLGSDFDINPADQMAQPQPQEGSPQDQA